MKQIQMHKLCINFKNIVSRFLWAFLNTQSISHTILISFRGGLYFYSTRMRKTMHKQDTLKSTYQEWQR